MWRLFPDSPACCRLSHWRPLRSPDNLNWGHRLRPPRSSHFTSLRAYLNCCSHINFVPAVLTTSWWPLLLLHRPRKVGELGRRTERWFQSMLSFGTDVACRLSYFIVDKLIDCAVHINTFTCCASFRPQNGALKMHEPSEPQSIVHRPSSTVHRPAIALISSEMCSDSNAF